MAHARFSRPEKSSVAQRILQDDLGLDNLKWIKEVGSSNFLNNYENVYLHKNRFSDSGPSN